MRQDTRGTALFDVLRLLPAYVSFGVLKHVVPLSRLARWAWSPPAGAGDDTAVDPERAVRAVTRISRRFAVTDRDCLQRSLVLYRELSRAGARPTLVMGFAPGTSGLAGHAWVETEARGPGRSVLSEDVSAYSAAAAFGDGGVVYAEASTPDDR